MRIVMKHVVAFFLFLLLLPASAAAECGMRRGQSGGRVFAVPAVVSHRVLQTAVRARRGATALLRQTAALDILPYADNEEGFAIAFPRGWTVAEDAFGSTVLFASPRTDNATIPPQSINVAIERIGSLITLDDYASVALRALGETLENFTYLGGATAQLGSLSASSITFTAEFEDSLLQFRQVWTLHGDRAYVVTFTSDAPAFDRAQPLVDAVLRSFTFLR